MDFTQEQIASLKLPPLEKGDNSTLGMGGVPDFQDKKKGTQNARDFLKTSDGKTFMDCVRKQVKDSGGNPSELTEGDFVAILKSEQQNQQGKVRSNDITWKQAESMGTQYAKNQPEKAFTQYVSGTAGASRVNKAEAAALGS